MTYKNLQDNTYENLQDNTYAMIRQKKFKISNLPSVIQIVEKAYDRQWPTKDDYD